MQVSKITAAIFVFFASPGISSGHAADEAPTALATGAAQTALTAALDRAALDTQSRWAFTMAYTEKDADGEKSYKLRYDPRLEDGAQWTLLEPVLSDLSKKEKKFLKNMQDGETTDAMLVYDTLEVNMNTAAITSESDEHAVFNVPLTDEEMPKKMREAVDMLVTVNKAGAFVETIELTAKHAFKPAPVAKLESFSQIQHYAPLHEDGPVLLHSAHSAVSGKAMFKKFNSTTHTEYSDFVRVAAAPDSPAR